MTSSFASVGDKTKTGALCTRMRMVSSRIRLELKTSVWRETCHVYKIRLWCGAQQHNTGSANTPPRVARLCQIREASLVALRKISQIYACSDVSIVRLGQSVIFASRDFKSHSSSLYHLSDELVSLSSVPMSSIDLNLWNRSHPSAFVPMSLGITSVLTDDIVKSFRNTKSWMNRNLVWMCFILRLAPCFVAIARAVLLSALACIKNDSSMTFIFACARINSTDNAPKAYISDFPLDKATVPLSSTFTRQQKSINVTQSARCAFPRHWITGPYSVRISRDMFRYRQIEIQFSCSFQISQHFLGTCQICKCWWRKFVWQAFSREHQIWSHSSNVLHFSETCSEPSSMPLRTAVEQCPSIRQRTWQ